MSAQQYIGLFIVAVGAGIVLAGALTAIIRGRIDRALAASPARRTGRNRKYRIAMISLAALASFFVYFAIRGA